MDPILIGLAFAFGLSARAIGQPPMVGFIAAGFAANLLGLQADNTLKSIADLGVTLLLFLIGLEMDPKRLFKLEVWGTAVVHAGVTTIIAAVGLMVFAGFGIAVAAGLNFTGALCVGFALSFSSTVFAVKNLEDRGEYAALHGRSVIGILILQDLIAVTFLTFAGGQIPEIWAIALIGIIAVRPILVLLLERAGHGELILLFGLFVALGLGAGVFEIAGLKPDLGALILGALLAGHHKAKEIVEGLSPLKGLLLVGFFLQIGLTGFPSWEQVIFACALIIFIFFKISLFFALFAALRFRVRSSSLGALALGTYSEFGLIVTALAVGNGWLSNDWIVTMALAVAASFIVAAPLQQAAHGLDVRSNRWLARFERRRRHPEERVIRFGDARIAVLGMGRVGTGAYDDLREQFGDVVVGVENDAVKIQPHEEAGRRVIQADVTDPAFWHRLERVNMDLILLAMPAHDSNMYAHEMLRESQYKGKVAAVARFPDEVEALEAAGVDVAFNMYAEAGAGFANHVRENMTPQSKTIVPGDPPTRS